MLLREGTLIQFMDATFNEAPDMSMSDYNVNWGTEEYTMHCRCVSRFDADRVGSMLVRSGCYLRCVDICYFEMPVATCAKVIMCIK